METGENEKVPKGLASDEGLPLNRGKMYISMTSPPVVREAYLTQFQQDFTMFLKCRSEEMVLDGCIVLILHGRQSADPLDEESCWQWELLAEAIAEMVSQGLIDEEKLDSFNVPYYTPSLEEVQDIVEKEGSFAIERLETSALEFVDKQEKDARTKGEELAKSIRSYTESLISYHFGKEILEKLFHKLTHIVVEDLAKESMDATSIIVVLSRIVG